MAIQPQLLSLLPFKSPLSPTDIGSDPDMFPPTPADQLQLATDMINVIENRVDINSFTPEYQKKIKSFYQFSATRYSSSKGKTANRTKNTLDII